MSALRSLRQLANSSARTFALRGVPRSSIFARSQLVQVARAGSAVNQFSSSARALGEGSCKFFLLESNRNVIVF